MELSNYNLRRNFVFLKIYNCIRNLTLSRLKVSPRGLCDDEGLNPKASIEELGSNVEEINFDQA